MQDWSADNSGIRIPFVSHYGNGQTELNRLKSGSKVKRPAARKTNGRPSVVCWDWLKTLTALQDPNAVFLCLKRARLKPQPPHCIYNYYYQNFYPSDPSFPSVLPVYDKFRSQSIGSKSNNHTPHVPPVGRQGAS